MDNNTTPSRAKARWKILAAALRNKDNVNEHSIRRFDGFRLFTRTLLTDGWYSYKWKAGMQANPVHVRLLSSQTSAEQLIGFNNTGNICIWASEEVLAHYALRHQEMFSGQCICEVGGGMTSLAGFQIASNMSSTEVVLTDGNIESVNNLNLIVDKNMKNGENNMRVSARKLVWSTTEDGMDDLKNSFDVIVCADCLFFVELHRALLSTIRTIMKDKGVCIMFAPSRGGTLEQFVKVAEETNMSVHVTERYDEEVWKLHEHAINTNKHYSRDIHYPIMVTLRNK